MQKELIRETQAQAQFPKWVIRAVSAMSASRLLYPPKPDICLLGRHGRNVPSIPDTPTATPSGEGPRPSQRLLPTRHDRQECLCSLRRSQCFTRVKSGSITSYDFLK